MANPVEASGSELECSSEIIIQQLKGNSRPLATARQWRARYLDNFFDGILLVTLTAAQNAGARCPVVTSVSAAVVPPQERPVFYIGADGIHTPMRGGGTCEAKVGVMFWSKFGAEAVMNLRACYLSNSQRWQNFWHKSSDDS